MKKIVIVDIDGTISDPKYRIHFLENNDWDSFYEACNQDEPIEDIIHLINVLNQSGVFKIIFCTGRRESVREKTKNWLKKYVGVWASDSLILMRKNGDTRHDTYTKIEALKENNIDLNSIAFVVEDRNSMVLKWRDLGITCLQPADGDF